MLISSCDYVERSPTCQHYSHESVSHERVVDEVPEPVEVGEDMVNHSWAGLQHEIKSGRELGYNKDQKQLCCTT